MSVMLINLFFLGPLAYLAAARPSWGALLFVLSFSVLALVARCLRAGEMPD